MPPSQVLSVEPGTQSSKLFTDDIDPTIQSFPSHIPVSKAPKKELSRRLTTSSVRPSSYASSVSSSASNSPLDASKSLHHKHKTSVDLASMTTSVTVRSRGISISLESPKSSSIPLRISKQPLVSSASPSPSSSGVVGPSLSNNSFNAVSPLAHVHKRQQQPCQQPPSSPQIDQPSPSFSSSFSSSTNDGSPAPVRKLNSQLPSSRPAVNIDNSSQPPPSNYQNNKHGLISSTATAPTLSTLSKLKRPMISSASSAAMASPSSAKPSSISSDPDAIAPLSQTLHTYAGRPETTTTSLRPKPIPQNHAARRSMPLLKPAHSFSALIDDSDSTDQLLREKHPRTQPNQYTSHLASNPPLHPNQTFQQLHQESNAVPTQQTPFISSRNSSNIDLQFIIPRIDSTSALTYMDASLSYPRRFSQSSSNTSSPTASSFALSSIPFATNNNSRNNRHSAGPSTLQSPKLRSRSTGSPEPSTTINEEIPPVPPLPEELFMGSAFPMNHSRFRDRSIAHAASSPSQPDFSQSEGPSLRTQQRQQHQQNRMSMYGSIGMFDEADGRDFADFRNMSSDFSLSHHRISSSKSQFPQQPHPRQHLHQDTPQSRPPYHHQHTQKTSQHDSQHHFQNQPHRPPHSQRSESQISADNTPSENKRMSEFIPSLDSRRTSRDILHSISLESSPIFSGSDSQKTQKHPYREHAQIPPQDELDAREKRVLQNTQVQLQQSQLSLSQPSFQRETQRRSSQLHQEFENLRLSSSFSTEAPSTQPAPSVSLSVSSQDSKSHSSLPTPPFASSTKPLSHSNTPLYSNFETSFGQDHKLPSEMTFTTQRKMSAPTLSLSSSLFATSSSVLSSAPPVSTRSTPGPSSVSEMRAESFSSSKKPSTAPNQQPSSRKQSNDVENSRAEEQEQSSDHQHSTRLFRKLSTRSIGSFRASIVGRKSSSSSFTSAFSSTSALELSDEKPATTVTDSTPVVAEKSAAEKSAALFHSSNSSQSSISSSVVLTKMVKSNTMDELSGMSSKPTVRLNRSNTLGKTLDKRAMKASPEKAYHSVSSTPSLSESPVRPGNRPSQLPPHHSVKHNNLDVPKKIGTTVPGNDSPDSSEETSKVRSKSTVSKQWSTISNSFSGSKRLLFSPFSSDHRKMSQSTEKLTSTQFSASVSSKPEGPSKDHHYHKLISRGSKFTDSGNNSPKNMAPTEHVQQRSQPQTQPAPQIQHQLSQRRLQEIENQKEVEAIMRTLVHAVPEDEKVIRRYEDAKKAGTLVSTAMTPSIAARTHRLNIYEKGEILDFRNVYFTGRPDAKKISGDIRHAVNNYGFDDKNGDYYVVPGDHIAYRYEILSVLGKGSFGKVLKCIDHKNGKLIAVKMIINRKQFHLQALVEADILRTLTQWDPSDKYHLVRYTNHFNFREHLCICTELLGINLYELIKFNKFKGLPVKVVRHFTQQILEALRFLDSKEIIHCDLKPENILLDDPIRGRVKIIDFGSSCYESEKVYTYIQSRFYRSPEVILGMVYNRKIDIWSMGCIIAELVTGQPLFMGENEQEQISCIMEVMGVPELEMINQCSRRRLFFDSTGNPRIHVSSRNVKRYPGTKSLKRQLKTFDDGLVDFIRQSLAWNPKSRISPLQGLRHDFIVGVPPKSPSMPSRNNSVLSRRSTISSTNLPVIEPLSGTNHPQPMSGYVPLKVPQQHQGQQAQRHSQLSSSSSVGSLNALVTGAAQKMPMRKKPMSAKVSDMDASSGSIANPTSVLTAGATSTGRPLPSLPPARANRRESIVAVNQSLQGPPMPSQGAYDWPQQQPQKSQRQQPAQNPRELRPQPQYAGSSHNNPGPIKNSGSSNNLHAFNHPAGPRPLSNHHRVASGNMLKASVAPPSGPSGPLGTIANSSAAAAKKPAIPRSRTMSFKQTVEDGSTTPTTMGLKNATGHRVASTSSLTSKALNAGAGNPRSSGSIGQGPNHQQPPRWR